MTSLFLTVSQSFLWSKEPASCKVLCSQCNSTGLHERFAKTSNHMKQKCLNVYANITNQINVIRWVYNIDEQIDAEKSLFLVGNKCDTQKRVVRRFQLATLVYIYHLTLLIHTSTRLHGQSKVSRWRIIRVSSFWSRAPNQY
jgi:hypothetical protein